MKIIKWLFKFLNLKNNKKENYLRSVFFNTIKQNGGSITVLEFAMKANITGIEARKYLDQYAVEFEANFDTTKEGCMVYLFHAIKHSDPMVNTQEKEKSLKYWTTNKRKNYNDFNHPQEKKSEVTKETNSNDIERGAKEIEKGIEEIGKGIKEMGKEMENLFKF
ncbi:MAG: hypothetical protein AAFQ80_24905 [Cyanobacteria bacterium J06621_8]